MSVEALERACLEAWPARTREQHFGWEFCATDGRSGRANAIWPIAWNGGDLDEAIEIASDWCVVRGITPTFKVADEATHPIHLPQALADNRFSPEVETLVMTRPIGDTSSSGLAELHEHPNADIWSPLNESAPDPADAAERRDIVERICASHRFGLVRHDGKPAAVGLGVLTGEWLGVYLMRTAPWARRNGFARDILNALTQWGASSGARETYLQVERANQAAIRLYQNEGFELAYQYRYWRR
ncbi:MAG: GNAT family N-acetyltransferase [Alphaproteobacteria bacterium]|nr:GNAT family N-acetyltransferase [Alphaproteobacteria bacterium]